MEVIQRILDLPVIVQGALGSALFWVILEFGQFLMRKIGEENTKTTRHNQTALHTFLASILDDNADVRRHMFQGVVYSTLHYLVKAVIFLVMGLIISNVIPVVGMVGYITGLFYLFRALAHVPHIDRWKSLEEAKNNYLELKAKSEKA